MVIVFPDRGDDPATGRSAAERALFAYRLGPGRPDYRADPIAVDRRCREAEAAEPPGAVESELRLTAGSRLVAYRRLAARSWAAFALPSYAEARPDGLSVGEALALLGRWYRWRDRLALEYRAEAELAALYGRDPAGPRPYRATCGLWFNRQRAFGLAAAAHWRGALAASGRARVDFGICDALADSPAGAERLDEDLERARAAAEAAEAAARSRMEA